MSVANSGNTVRMTNTYTPTMLLTISLQTVAGVAALPSFENFMFLRPFLSLMPDLFLFITENANTSTVSAFWILFIIALTGGKNNVPGGNINIILRKGAVQEGWEGDIINLAERIRLGGRDYSVGKEALAGTLEGNCSGRIHILHCIICGSYETKEGICDLGGPYEGGVLVKRMWTLYGSIRQQKMEATGLEPVTSRV